MNKKLWLVVAVVVLTLILLGLVLKFKILGRQGPGAIQVNSNPKAIVYVDNAQVGSTPFMNDKIKTGEHTVKLVPEGSDTNLISWEGKIDLSPGVMIVINRNLGESDFSSSGQTLTLEKVGSKDKASLSVTSIPDNSVVKIDGEPKGFTPLSIDSFKPGSYLVTVSSPGYEEESISAKPESGYKLIVNVQLARKIEGIEDSTASAEQEEATSSSSTQTSPTPTPKVKASVTPSSSKEIEKPYVTIKDTPTGWLRVRSEPKTSASEVAKVDPGKNYPYLGEKENGWLKIEYEKGKEGWISATYADLVE